MKKTCLNCKHEPEWGDIVGHGEFERRHGVCKKNVLLPVFPACFSAPHKNSIVRYSDDSLDGLHGACKCWEPKGE